MSNFRLILETEGGKRVLCESIVLHFAFMFQTEIVPVCNDEFTLSSCVPTLDFDVDVLSAAYGDQFSGLAMLYRLASHVCINSG